MTTAREKGVLATWDEAMAEQNYMARSGCANMTVMYDAGLHAAMKEGRATVAELIDCIGDAQSLLAEIDSAVRAEHKKNGHPKSKSIAGIINERLTAALARANGESP